MSTFTKLGHCVYVLFSEADGKLYVGYSTDLKQRLTDHFNGRNQATAPRRPLHLIYCEYHASTTDAHRRAKYFKTTAGKKALGLMLRDTLSDLRGCARSTKYRWSGSTGCSKTGMARRLRARGILD